jgi:AbrB family looped-hinge helix DNA binding protein
VETATVSPKYQVVIPKSIRDKLRLVPGQKVQAVAFKGRVELIPLRSARELRGFAQGIDTTVPREGDRV